MPDSDLFLSIFGIFAIASPVLLGYVLFKYSKLRGEVARLYDEARRYATENEHQVSKLTARVHALEVSAASQTANAASQPQLIVPPVTISPEELRPAPPQPSHSVLEQKPIPEKPVVPPPPTITPATPKPPQEQQLLKPAETPSFSQPPLPAKEPKPQVLKSSPPPPPPQLRYAAPKPSLSERIKKVTSLEETLGRDWLLKLGIVILVVGLALFGIYEFSTMGAVGKSAISFSTAVAFLVGGILFEKRENYRLLGRTLIGGGWALLFFTSYAVHHVAAMRVLNSLTLDSLFMLLVAVAMGAHTLRYRSQFVTGLAFLLAYTTVALSHDTVYSLSAGVVLAIGLVFIVLKMNWFELEVFGILSSYLNQLYWLFRLLGPEGANGHPFSEYRASLAMLIFYWLAFRISYIIRRIKTDSEENVSTAAALLNTLLLLVTMKFQSVQPQLAYIALLSIGLLEFSFAQFPITRRRRRAFILLTVMGAALMIAAPPFHYSANNVAVLWLLGAELFLVAGVLAKEVVFRRIGLLTGILVGFHLAVLDFPSLLDFRSHGDAPLLSAGVLFGLCSIVLYGNFLTALTRWKGLFEVSIDTRLLQAHSYIAAASAAVAAWALTTQDWTAVAFAGIMLAVAAVGRRFRTVHSDVQFAAIGLLTAARAVTVNLHSDSASGLHIPLRQMTLSILSAAFYLAAALAPRREDSWQNVLRGVFSTFGSALLAFLIWYELPASGIAVGWIALAVALVLVGHKLRYAPLVWQANILAAVAALRTFFFNFDRSETLWSFLTVRIVSVCLVAAGLYFLARKAAPDPRAGSIVAYLHSFAATALLATLGWYESPNGWLAPLWIAFALILALVDRRFELPELAWQAHVLSLLTLARCVTFNLQFDAAWHGFSVRLLSLAIVSLALYAMCRAVRMPDEWRDHDFHHAYSWAASALLSLMLWYELVPLNVAIGWAVFGLVLFEYGALRAVTQFRYQAYLALLASFARIFFANLTAGEPGGFWGPRTYTILPLVPIYFFVYVQVTASSSTETNEAGPRQFSIAALLATLGTATVVAFFYFQFPLEWVVTSWAALVVVLFAIVYFFRRGVFLYQGLLLSFLVLFRGMSHNLFGASYFTEGDWQGKFFVLGSAIALLLLTLAFAYPLRVRFKENPNAHASLGLLSKLASRPEQIQFFIPIVLLTVMLALKTRAGMVTVSWGVEGVGVILLALALRERSFRLTGLGLLLLCVGKVLILDVWGLQPRDRYLTFIILGAALVFVSYLYSRYRDTIRQLL